MLWSDTATGLLAWRHFVAGGTWNTLPLPDPADIARVTEQAVTWWSPGQYVPLGLLNLAGVPLGTAMLLLAFAAAVATGIGLAALARALGAPERALPWIAIGVTGGWHALYAFGMFNGGETAQIAVWPWIALAAWRLRTRPLASVAILPGLFLIGSFAKHSFAIAALALLIFLWLEALRGSPRDARHLCRATWPIAAIGILYIVGRRLVFDAGASPADPGQASHTFTAMWGFGAFAPWFAATGAGSVAGRIFHATGLAFERGWAVLGLPLTLLSPLPLALYAWMTRRRAPLARLAGLTCLVTIGVLFVLLWRGGSISLEDRHYRPAGVLLLAAGVAAGFDGSRRLAWVTRGLVSAIVLYGLGALLQRHLTLGHRFFPAENGVAVSDVPRPVLAEIFRVARAGDDGRSLLYLPNPTLAVPGPPGRLLVTDAIDRDAAWIAAQPRHGRVPRLTLVLPARFDPDGRAAALRASFVDYRPDEWTRRRLDDWDFWQARTP